MDFKKYIILLALCGGMNTYSNAQQTAIHYDAQANFKRGMEFYEQKLYAKAQEEFEKVMATPPNTSTTEVMEYRNRAELYAALVALYLEQKDAEKRLRYLIAKYEPSAVATRAKLAMGDFYYANKDYKLAIKYYSKIRSLELKNDEIIAMKFKLGYSYFAEKKLNKAKGLFLQIKGSKDSPDYYYSANYYYGVIVFKEGNYKEALQSFQKAKRSPRYSKIIPSYICQIYFAEKNYDKLISYGEPLVKDNTVKERQQIAQLIGQTYFEKENFAKALPYMEEYVGSSKKVTKELLYQLGYTQYKTKKYKEAIANFNQLNGLKSLLGQNAIYNMADCYLKIGNKQQAFSAFERASKLNYDTNLQNDAQINAAKLAYELGNNFMAIDMLIEVKGNYYNEAQNLLSDIFLKIKDYKASLEYLQKIENKTPTLRETHQKVAFFRGIQLYKSHNYTEAIKLFKESKIQGNHQDTKALCDYWMAESYFKLQKNNESLISYDAFIRKAKKGLRLPDNSSVGTAYYGRGYAYIKSSTNKEAKIEENYRKAVGEFEKSVRYFQKNSRKIKDSYVTTKVYPDALLRAGDCNLFLRKYTEANKYYKKIIQAKYPNADYALYQQSVIFNLKGSLDQQIKVLDKVIANYPQSSYIEEAYYQKGTALLRMEKYNQAIQVFKQFKTKYPQSKNLNRATLKQGKSAYGQGNYDLAIQYYKQILDRSTQGEEAKDALNSIRDILIKQDRYDNYVSLTKDYSIDVEQSELDSTQYAIAKLTFQKENYQLAIQKYTDYLSSFPQGLNRIDAYFYRGLSSSRIEDYASSYKDYEQVLLEKNSPHYNTACLQAAKIAYYLKNYEGAYKYYSEYKDLATTDVEKHEALERIVNSAYALMQYDNFATYVENYVQHPLAAPSNKIEAYYKLGDVYLKQEKFDLALTTINTLLIIDEENNKAGDADIISEAKYYKMFILYKQGDLKTAKDLCLTENKNIKEYWFIRSFILLGDIYMEEQKYPHAKANLARILDYLQKHEVFKNDMELISLTKEKLAKAEAAEKKLSKLKEDKDDGGVEFVD